MTAITKTVHGTGARFLSLILLLCSLLGMASQAVAQSGLKRVGPVDPVTGFPLWYEDFSGLKLGLCIDQNRCFFFPPDANLPVSYPGNWPDEFFYYAIDGLMLGTTGRASIRCALEGAYLNGAVVPGDEMVFTRIRVRVSDLIPNGSYTALHPYGTEELIAEADGTIFFTRDIGALAARDFGEALKGDLNTFCLPAGVSASSFTNGDYIADAGLTLIQINGSSITVANSATPVAQNFFRIIDNNPQGATPALQVAFPAYFHAGDANTGGRPYIQLDEFAMQGRVPPQFGVGVDRADYSLRNSNSSNPDDIAVGSAANVWAQSASGQNLVATLPVYGTVPMTEAGSTGHYYARIALNTAIAPPATVTVQNLTDIPVTSASGVITDQVRIESARFTVSDNNALTLEDLIVTASSSDHVSAVTFTATPEGFGSATLPTSGGSATGGCGLAQGIPAPQSVTVTSSLGGSATVKVEVAGAGVQTISTEPVIANAGPDQTVLADTKVQLDGGGSTGPISMTYQWSHNFPGTLILSDATLANPTFTSPTNLPGGAIDITFTLTVTDPVLLLASQDTVVVHVNDPVSFPVDTLTITDARYIQSKAMWRASGTASVLAGQTVRVYLDDPRTNWTAFNAANPGLTPRPRRIGAAVVDAAGGWSFQNGNNTANADGTVPLGTDGLVWAQSDWVGGSTVPAFGFQRK